MKNAKFNIMRKAIYFIIKSINSIIIKIKLFKSFRFCYVSNTVVEIIIPLIEA